MSDKIKIPQRDERLAVCRLMVSMAKTVHASIYGANANFGANIDGVFIACAVLIGHAEQRPMTTNKLALFLGMKRQTVQRKLDVLVEMDVLARKGRLYYVSRNRLQNDGHVLDALHQTVRRSTQPERPK